MRAKQTLLTGFWGFLWLKTWRILSYQHKAYSRKRMFLEALSSWKWTLKSHLNFLCFRDWQVWCQQLKNVGIMMLRLACRQAVFMIAWYSFHSPKTLVAQGHMGMGLLELITLWFPLLHQWWTVPPLHPRMCLILLLLTQMGTESSATLFYRGILARVDFRYLVLFKWWFVSHKDPRKGNGKWQWFQPTSDISCSGHFEGKKKGAFNLEIWTSLC